MSAVQTIETVYINGVNIAMQKENKCNLIQMAAYAIKDSHIHNY